MTDVRMCEQCGASFVPRREHARFCCARCRAAWNREHAGDPKAGTSALEWSVSAMSDATERLSQTAEWDTPRAFAVICEAVWWVTIVDATLVRHFPDAYDAAMADLTSSQRELIEGTLAGLRFVRNQIGGGTDPCELIDSAQARPEPAMQCLTGWTWRPVPKPVLASLPPRGKAWELQRFRAYQARLAGRTIGETITRDAAFLKLAAAPSTR
jgi:hypothetical protein